MSDRLTPFLRSAFAGATPNQELTYRLDSLARVAANKRRNRTFLRVFWLLLIGAFGLKVQNSVATVVRLTRVMPSMGDSRGHVRINSSNSQSDLWNKAGFSLSVTDTGVRVLSTPTDFYRVLPGSEIIYHRSLRGQPRAREIGMNPLEFIASALNPSIHTDRVSVDGRPLDQLTMPSVPGSFARIYMDPVTDQIAGQEELQLVGTELKPVFKTVVLPDFNPPYDLYDGSKLAKGPVVEMDDASHAFVTQMLGQNLGDMSLGKNHSIVLRKAEMNSDGVLLIAYTMNERDHGIAGLSPISAVDSAGREYALAIEDADPDSQDTKDPETGQKIHFSWLVPVKGKATWPTTITLQARTSGDGFLAEPNWEPVDPYSSESVVHFNSDAPLANWASVAFAKPAAEIRSFGPSPMIDLTPVALLRARTSYARNAGHWEDVLVCQREWIELLEKRPPYLAESLWEHWNQIVLADLALQRPADAQRARARRDTYSDRVPAFNRSFWGSLSGASYDHPAY